MLSCRLTALNLGNSSWTIFAQVSVTCLRGLLIAFKLFINDHWVLQAFIFGTPGLDLNIFLIMAGDSGIVHASSGAIDYARLWNSTASK
jgi:hypothetical protein